jgi:tRNA(Arg) A34 adenosine deaminase TadA
MCTGTLYWANIGRLVYGFEETMLLALTGDHVDNTSNTWVASSSFAGMAIVTGSRREGALLGNTLTCNREARYDDIIPI